MPQQKLYSYVVNNYPVTTTLAMSVYSFAIQKYLHCCWSNLYGFWKSRLAILLGLSQNRLCICLPRFLARTDDPLILGWIVSFREAKCRFLWATNETSGFSTSSEQTSALKRSLFACRFGSFTGGILLTKTFRLGRSFKIPFNDFTIALLAPFESFVLISLIPQCTTIAFTDPVTDSSDFTVLSILSVFFFSPVFLPDHLKSMGSTQSFPLHAI